MVRHEKKEELMSDEHQQPPANVRSAPAGLSRGALIGIAALVAVAAGALGFVGGMQFQKGNNSRPMAMNQRGGGFGMGRMRMSEGGSFGKVTAVSDTSITIAARSFERGANTQTTNKTFAITSATKITVNGGTGKAGDIATGDTVMVEADSSDSSVAASIRVGMSGMGASSSM